MSEDEEQSELGTTSQSIAEELAEQQQQASIAEFFGENKQMLGFDSPSRALVTTVKEAVDNALDACEDAGILPDIYVNIERTDDYYSVTIEDNGPGITKEQIPKVFGRLLYGSRFHTREQNRGQQGIGISAAVLYAQRTSGKPARIVSRPKGHETAHYYELSINEENNESDIRREDTANWDKEHGTRITVEIEGNMRARSQLHDYIERTAVVNPHARIEFHEPKTHSVYERSSNELPPETEEILPHPHGVELGTLMSMLRNADETDVKTFLQNEFVRVGRKGSENILDTFRDYHHGREMRWPATNDHETVEERVHESSHGLDEEVADALASAVAEQVTGADIVTKTDVEKLVDSAANEVESAHTTRIHDPLHAEEKTVWVTVKTGGADNPETLSRWTDDGADETAIGQQIRDETKRKADTAVNQFANDIVTELASAGRLTRDQIADIVDEAADSTEDSTGETFGSTSRRNVRDRIWNHFTDESTAENVRKTVADAIWPVVPANRASHLYTHLDDVTTAQKDDEAVKQLAVTLASTFQTHGGRERLVREEVKAFIDAAADETEEETGERFGDKSRENILNHLWDEMQSVKGHVPPVNTVANKRDIAQQLLEAMRETNILAPPTDCLAPIGEQEIRTGLKTVYDKADFYTSVTRDSDTTKGDPFIVEAGIAYGPDIFENGEDGSELLRFANRVPLVYQRGACAATDVVKGINWRNYFTGSSPLNQKGGRGIPTGPMVILIHVASTNVPFTSEAKDAIANVEAIEDEMELALRECARDLKSHLTTQRDLEQRRTKQRVVGEILPQIASKAAEVAGQPEPADTTQSMARIMNSVMLHPNVEENEISIENYANGAESLTLRLKFDEKPTYPSHNVEREETTDGWELVWEDRLERGESAEITWNNADTPTITYEDIPTEKMSTTDRTLIQTE